MRISLLIISIFATFMVTAQRRPLPSIGGLERMGTTNPGVNRNPDSDTAKAGSVIEFEHRDDLKDSIRITFKFLDSIRNNKIDSSINDFDTYYSIPTNHLFLGNNGSATLPIIFTPWIKPGWDAGLHAFDAYKYTLENTRIYRTTRPFTSLGYQLAGGKEQMIKAMHTQNPRPNLNWGLDYRLITAPGMFITQNTNHNNMRLFSNYAGKSKRYNGTFVIISNYLRASENGGIQHDSSLSDPTKKKRFFVPVNLGNSANFYPNPFQTSIYTGNLYRTFDIQLKQSYDIGKKDSLVINDTIVEPLFFPKLRLEHSFTYSTHNYLFRDVYADSSLYASWYNIRLRKPQDTLLIAEKWKIIKNDFSIYQYPDIRNTAQFFKLGATMENLHGKFDSARSDKFTNIILHGEYRNISRNRKWNMILKGEFYAAGRYFGNYQAYAHLARYINRKLGFISVNASNILRNPSYIYESISSFNLGNKQNFKDENILTAGAKLQGGIIELGFTSYLINNYTYYAGLNQQEQYSSPISVNQISASKHTVFGRKKRWNWYSDLTIQITGSNTPVKVPLVCTRNRIAYEGVFFKNLNLSTGLDIRYFTPYKMNGYSPAIGQFYVQDSLIKNRPDITAFLHFRIKPFTAFIRAENINTLSKIGNSFGFYHNNFAAPHYPTPGFNLRVGIRWWFVN